MNRRKTYAKRANINCFDLAKEIEVRPIIWDVRNVSHHNRVALNENWNEIGNILNQPKEVCRKKWKYLKDQFRKELRMELRKGLKFKSTWDLYKPLSYIKPHFKSLLLPHGEADNSSIEDESETALDDDPILENDDVTIDVDSENDAGSDEVEEVNEDVVDITQEDDNDSAVILSEGGKSHVKQIKLSINPPNTHSEYSSDGSDNFFKSLLPFMKQMTNIQKLRVRNTIQNVILHELELEDTS